MPHPSAAPSSQDCDTLDATSSPNALPCVLCFNANDPLGAGGVSSDTTVIASMGGHALPVVTGTYLRDSRETQGHADMDESAVAEQARLIAEDAPIQAIKVGFVGSAETLAAIAAFAADYAEAPLIAYMPDLSWWTDHDIDQYLDAFRELLLPQTAVLVGNNVTLRHWLLPESVTDRHPHATDLARAAAEWGVSYVLVTGVPMLDDQIGNVLASPQMELLTHKFERIDAGFVGAGDILSAALTGLLATGDSLESATAEALQYLDEALDHGFLPGMGRAVADRLFWADAGGAASADGTHLQDTSDPSHETHH
jgi:hydroxymethylpyrimidine/phosphomethylpyrimidine kinase